MRCTAYLTLIAALFLPGCVGDGPGVTDSDSGGADLCESADEPTLEIGHGVGGSFQPYEDGEEVQLSVAPQGGFGITVVLATTGLQAHGDSYVDILLDVERAGVNEGTFFLPASPLLCSGSEIGGKLSGIVAGFDSQKYQSNDDLLALDGEVVDVVATVTDENGATVQARQPLTVRVGG